MEQRDERSKELEINLLPLFKKLLKNLWIMVLVGLLLGAAAFAGAKLLLKPVYRSSFTAYVNNQQTQNTKDILTNSDINASKELVRTYSQIIRSNSILGAAAKTIYLDKPYSVLRSMVTTEVHNETEIISVHVVSEDPQLSYDYANAIAQTAPSYMAEIVEGSSMKIIDYPVYSEVPFGPNYMKYAFVAFLAGVLLVALIVIIKYFKDDTVKSESEIETQFSLPVLGVIPDVNTSEGYVGKYSAERYGYGGYGYGGYGHSKESEKKGKENSDESK